MQWDEILPLKVMSSFLAPVISQGLIPIFSCRSSCISRWGGAAGIHLCVCRALGLLPAFWSASRLLLVSSAVNAGDELAPILQSCSESEMKVTMVLGGEWHGHTVQSLRWALGLFPERDLCTVCRHCRRHVWCPRRAALAVPGHVSAAAGQKPKPRGWD